MSTGAVERSSAVNREEDAIAVRHSCDTRRIIRGNHTRPFQRRGDINGFPVTAVVSRLVDVPSLVRSVENRAVVVAADTGPGVAGTERWRDLGPSESSISGVINCVRLIRRGEPGAAIRG